MTQNQQIRILVVDDKQVVRDGISLFLNIFDDLEFIGVATNGKEAIEMCESLSPDVVLMDIVMPEMDGISATQIIKEKYPNIAVVGLTSIYNDESQVQAIIDAGAVACLPKNASIQDIELAIRNVKP